MAIKHQHPSGLDIADAARVIEWAHSRPRKPAATAFTAGPERQAAYWIEWAEAAERARCCRVVAVQGADDGRHVAKRTILAIQAGDDFFDADDEVAGVLLA